jgi:hypothetical protein
VTSPLDLSKGTGLFVEWKEDSPMPDKKGTKKGTAEACVRITCAGCEIEGKLLCVHTPMDLLDFAIPFMGWLIPFTAGMIIGRFWIGLGVWLGLAAVFFLYVEEVLLCRHCPHYAEDGFFLRCHANWGLPKIPGRSTRPMSSLEKTVWVAYVLILFLFYIPFFVISRQWLLLLITSWGALCWAWVVVRTQCNRCFNLSCPANRVPEDVRRVFFENYPEYKEEWNRRGKKGRGK